jgi:predicted ArsR family transcriptional regulator
MTVSDLSGEIGITPMAIRQHLSTLEGDALVHRQTLRRGVGRPSHIFSLTPQAEGLFPKSYDRLAHELLTSLEALDGRDKVWAVFRKRMENLYEENIPRMDGKTLPERIKELTKIQEEMGHMPEWRQENGQYTLVEHNCSICSVAERYPVVCELEARLFSRLLDADIKRHSRIAEGDHTCTFEVTVAAK